jgi:hypothetical protein
VKILAGIIILLAGNFFISFQEKAHGKNCPKDCKICTESIKKGLDSLVKRQFPSGGWCWRCRKKLKKHIHLDEGRELLRGANDHVHTVFSSLAILALLSEGSTPTKGRYREAIKKGLDFLLASSSKDGAIWHCYAAYKKPTLTALALLTLLEIYLRISNKELKGKIKSKVKKAIRYLEKSAKGGAWNYKGVQDHVGTTYGVLASLCIAKDCGFGVKEKIIKKAVKYLLRCIRRDGKVNYSRSVSYERDELRARKSYRPGGVLFALKRAGAQNTEKFRKLKEFFTSIRLDKILQLKKQWGWHPILVHKHLYGFFFATLGAREVGGKKWKRWFTTARDFLLKIQDKSGEWKKVSPVPIIGDRMVTRGMLEPIALIILQLPLDNLEILKR